MFFHGKDRESLHAHLDPKYLPTTYGGIRPEYSYTEWFESLGKNPEIIKGKTYITVSNKIKFYIKLNQNTVIKLI